MIIAGIVGVTAMIGYAFLSGLVAVEITDASQNELLLENESRRPEPPNFRQFSEFVGGQEDEETNESSE